MSSCFLNASRDGDWLPYFPGNWQPVSTLDKPFSEEIVPEVQPKPPWLSLWQFPSCSHDCFIFNSKLRVKSVQSDSEVINFLLANEQKVFMVLPWSTAGTVVAWQCFALALSLCSVGGVKPSLCLHWLGTDPSPLLPLQHISVLCFKLLLFHRKSSWMWWVRGSRP